MIRLEQNNFCSRSLLARLTLIVCVLSLPAVLTGCPKKDGPDKGVGISQRSPEPTTPAVVPGTAGFNGERAMDHVRKQVEIGPRPPGSPELAKTREYISKTLSDAGLKVSLDEFSTATPHGTKKMVNITAELAGESNDVIIIGSHYDTKVYKDMRFVGANDPAASVATVLELGRVLANQQKPKLTYWLVFFDGEESFCEGWDDCGKPDAPDNTYGSRRYVSRLQTNNQLNRVRALVLLDMMGYKNLELGRDTMSTKWLQDIIWRTGRELGHGKVFVDRPESVGGDDHEPFLRAGVDAVDLIQLNGYPYWHTPDDTADKVSGASMKIVADTVLASLPRIEQYVQSKQR